MWGPLHRAHEPRAQRRQRAGAGRPADGRRHGHRHPAGMARNRLRGGAARAPGGEDRRHRGAPRR